jgi:NADPH-dependent F420 reductase
MAKSGVGMLLDGIIPDPQGLARQKLDNKKETIAILGGTGDLGTGLAIRWSKAGHNIIIGSRTLEKAQTAVANLAKISPETPAQAMENSDAAAAGDIVVLTVPADHQLSTLDSVRAGLTGKILIDVTVPLVPPKVGTVQLPPEGSAGKRAQDHLGEDVMVVTAFQNIAAHLLQEDVAIECDVLIAGNKKEARDKVMELVEAAGMTGWHAGPIENSAAAEALTSILIQINRRHDISHSGIKIVGQADH